MFCTNCGANVPDGAKFCSSCGAKLHTDAESIDPAMNADAKKPFGQASEFEESGADGMDAYNAPPLKDFSQQTDIIDPASSDFAQEAPNAELSPQNAAPQMPDTGQPVRRPQNTISLKVLCGILGVLGVFGVISNLVSLIQMLGSFRQINQSLSMIGIGGSFVGMEVLYVIYMLISLVLSAILVFVYCIVVFRWTPERNDGFFVAITALEVLNLLVSIVFTIIFSILMGPLLNSLGIYGALLSRYLGVGTVIGCVLSLLFVPGLYYLLSYLAGLTPLKTKGGFSAFFTELKKAPAMIIECAKSMKK